MSVDKLERMFKRREDFNFLERRQFEFHYVVWLLLL